MQRILSVDILELIERGFLMNVVNMVMRLRSLKARYDNAPEKSGKGEIAALVHEYDEILSALAAAGADVSDIPSITAEMD